MLSDAFYSALAQRESRGNPKVVNSFGFMGLYQMGIPALQDVGYVNSDSNWTGKDGIRSQDDFLNNPDIQTKAIRAYHKLVWDNYLPQEVKDSVGTKIKGIKVTKSGLVAAAHLVGHGGLKDFVESNGEIDRKDEIGTKCSEYLKQFGGY